MLTRFHLYLPIALVTLLLGCSDTTSQHAPQDSGLDSGSSDLGAMDLGTGDMAADLDTEQPALEPPAELERWLTGSPEDAKIATPDPGLILMGGGREPDEAFQWWQERIPGGDIVVLRVSGSDGYNDYLFSEIGGFDSIETLKVTSRELADDPYVIWQVDHAEGVFIAGGDQWDYLSLWGDTQLGAALERVYSRGGHLGGTSAGLAVLGDWSYSAEIGSVTSEEALLDPFHMDVTFEEGFLELPQLPDTITDSHFAERDRMGRLVAFVARMKTAGISDPRGIGVDESTALLITAATGSQVVGRGSVYELRSITVPEECSAGVPLRWGNINVTRTNASTSHTYNISASDGELAPQNPY